MIGVLFLIRSLNRGGAERQLALLIEGMDRKRFSVTVVTLYEGGALRPELESLDGVQVLSLNKHGRWDIVLPILRLTRILRKLNPQVVHGYMDVANILALILGKTIGASVVWGLRASDVDFTQYDRVSALCFRVAAWLSRFSDLIIANSYAGKHHHATHGYCSNRMLVLPNGFDTERFQADDAARRRMRCTWGINDDELLIGLVARLDPIKDHRTFLRAAALLATSRRDVRFVCVGEGSSSYRQELRDLAKGLGIEDQVIWAGVMSDMRAVHNALDIATSSSLSEGFSNTIGEAMACGVPCVVTDVGDSPVLVGKTGLVVPPRDPSMLAAAWREIIEMSPKGRAALAEAARDRIVTEYSIWRLVDRTQAALFALVSQSDDPGELNCEQNVRLKRYTFAREKRGSIDCIKYRR